MALCGFLAFLFGFLAGWRFRVMILLPLEAAAMAVAFALVTLGRVGWGEACIGLIVATFALQIGYGLALACPLPAKVSVRRHSLEA